MKPYNAAIYHDLCSSDNPATTYLLGDDLDTQIEKLTKYHQIASNVMQESNTDTSSKKYTSYKTADKHRAQYRFRQYTHGPKNYGGNYHGQKH